MKKPMLIALLLGSGLYITLSSNSAGPASSGNGIRNGGPGSNGTCASCHGGGSGTTGIALSLKEKASGNPANGGYKPGTVYTVTLSGSHPQLPFFGFQLSAVRSNHQQAGSFANMGDNKHISILSGLQVVEHSTSLPAVNGNYEASFDWTAPPGGSGTVTFHAILNGVNNDHTINGDRASAPLSLSLTEEGSTAIASLTAERDLQLFPNPTTGILHIRSRAADKGAYMLSITDMQGKRVAYRDYEVQAAMLDITLPLDGIAPGMYLMQLSHEGKAIRRHFSKL